MVDCLYVLTRAIRPSYVIETGVAYGSSSALILAAMAHENHGRLTSIDLPSANDMAGHQSGSNVGIFVPRQFRSRWDLIEGDSLVHLPRTLAIETPQIFIHDSYHSYAHMAFEYGIAARYLAPNSLIVSDDTRCNSSFHDVMLGIDAEVFNHARNPAVSVAVTR